MVKLKNLITTATLCCALTVSYANANDKVIAKYNGKDMHQSTVEEKIKLFFNDSLPENKKDFNDLSADIKQKIVMQLVQQGVLEDAMNKSSIKDGEKYKKQFAELKKQFEINFYLDNYAKSKLTDSAVKSEYNSYIKTLKDNDELKISHILVKTENEASKILQDIKSGKVSFEQAAKDNSLDGSKNKGGEIGYISKGQTIPEFEKAAYALKKDKISDPVKTDFGWHLIKVTEIKKRPIPKLEEIKQDVEQAVAAKIKQDYVASLIKDAKIETFIASDQQAK